MAKKKGKAPKVKTPPVTNKKGAVAETKRRMSKRGACGHG